MEEVNVGVPGGGELKALRLQDLPADHVLAFIQMPDGPKQAFGVKLFRLASGPAGSSALDGMTFGELEHVVTEWLILSAESESEDQDGQGSGLDWSELPR